jgi:hypothetical protein
VLHVNESHAAPQVRPGDHTASLCAVLHLRPFLEPFVSTGLSVNLHCTPGAFGPEHIEVPQREMLCSARSADPRDKRSES